LHRDRAYWRRYHTSTFPTAFQPLLSSRKINTPPFVAQKGKLHPFMVRVKSLEYYDELKKSEDFYKICFIKAPYFLNLFIIPFLYN
jgi:hypothetical protein